jgi:hypothetical protein
LNLRARVKKLEDMPPEIICDCPSVRATLGRVCGKLEITIIDIHEIWTTECLHCGKNYTGPHACTGFSHIPMLAVDIGEGELN